MNELQMLHNLEIIRDLLAPIIQERTKDRFPVIQGLVEAHRTAHYACESAYASMESEAHAMELAQGEEDYDYNRNVYNPTPNPTTAALNTPRDVLEHLSSLNPMAYDKYLKGSWEV